MKKNKIIIRIILVIMLIIVLWLTGVIPQIIGKQAAINYVKENHIEINLTYKSIEYSTAYGDYIATFFDEAGNAYNFRLSSKHFPTSVAYDGIKQSNVN